MAELAGWGEALLGGVIPTRPGAEGPPEAPERWRSAQEVGKRYPGGVPRMDPLDDLGIDEPQALAAVRRMEALEAQLATNAAFLVRVRVALLTMPRRCTPGCQQPCQTLGRCA